MRRGRSTFTSLRVPRRPPESESLACLRLCRRCVTRSSPRPASECASCRWQEMDFRKPSDTNGREARSFFLHSSAFFGAVEWLNLVGGDFEIANLGQNQISPELGRSREVPRQRHSSVSAAIAATYPAHAFALFFFSLAFRE